MRKLLSYLLLALMLSLTACGDGTESDPDSPEISSEVQAMKGALPKAEEMSINLPSSSNLVPEQAEFYAFTRGVTLSVNGFVRNITNIIEDVVEQPPSETGEGYALWGPHTDALSPATWQVRVDVVSEGNYHYVVQGWPKESDSTLAATILEGTHVEGEPNTGGWRFDLSAAHALDPIAHDSLGVVSVAYSMGAARGLEVTFEEVQGPRQPMATSSFYRYTEAVDGSGTFDFISNMDIHQDDDPNLNRRELLQVRSRWLPEGPGRADLIATHGDIPEGLRVDLIECWNSAFMRSYIAMTYADFAEEDGEVADCPYAERETPSFEEFDASSFVDADLVRTLPEPADFEVDPAPVSDPVAQPADQYSIAKGAIETINQQVGDVLGHLQAIAAYPPSTCSDEGCLWGPWSENGISFYMGISRPNADGAHSFELKVKPFAAPMNAWEMLVSGGYLEAEAENQGRGFFALDYDILSRYESDVDASGMFYADFIEEGEISAVAARFDEFQDYSDASTGEPVEIRYFFRQSSEGGALDIRFPHNIDDDPEVELIESHVRWLSDGAGTGNAVISDADGQARVVECWDEQAAEVYEQVSLEGEPEIAEICAFTDWVEPSFPSMHDEQDSSSGGSNADSSGS